MKIRKKLAWMFLLGVPFLLSACGRKPVSQEHSPQLVSGEILSYNEGSEDSQFVKVNLVFDRDISVAEDMDSLRVTISGERMEGQIQMADEPNTASLVIPVKAITSGVLKIQKSEKADTIDSIRDSSGSYAAGDFQLEGLIPTGVTLSTVTSGNGKIVKQVDFAWSIRSITWIALSQNKELIPVLETHAGENLDGYAAVHGHEFLTDDVKDAAERITETLKNNYGEEYRFTCEDSVITAQRIDGEGALDIEIYQYLKIDGKDVETESDGNEGPEDAETEEQHPSDKKGDSQADSPSAKQEASPSDSHEESHGESGLKVKTTEVSREMTHEEQNFLDRLHISHMKEIPKYQGVKDGTEVYTAFILTGNAMPEKQVYSVRDLETLIQDSFQNESLYSFTLPMEHEGYYGIHLPSFLSLCGVEGKDRPVSLRFTGRNQEERTYSLEELTENTSMLALAKEGGPLDADSETPGPVSLLVFRNGKMERVGNLEEILAGTDQDLADPEYETHSRKPFTDSKDAAFTIQVYQQGAEYLGAVKQARFTTEELETLRRENPQSAAGGYFGTVGNAQYFSHMGVGGWLDYFEGISLKWLLKKQMGLDTLKGYAELIDRDGEIYTSIEDLAYLSGKDADEYYTLTSDGIRIPGTVPMIAFAKNGYPLLPEHDHESEGYIAYNRLNQTLEESGVHTETGVVKNHSGPFTACLGNRDGYYGGNQVETGGDCVEIRLYLESVG